MDRDRLTSRGWSWHQGLVRFLDVEEAMFQCTGGCKSCDEHSEELQCATDYATRSIRQPVPHMDAVAGEKLRTMSNRALGNELDRWADARDRSYRNLDSIALRVTAERLRRMAEGCDHPVGCIWRNETEDFCQQCGAVVTESGETQQERWRTPPRGGSRADGPMLTVPRTDCGVRTEHDQHGDFNSDRRLSTYCSGQLIDDSKGDDLRGLPYEGVFPPHTFLSAFQGLSTEQVDDLGELHSALGALSTTLSSVADALETARSAGVSDRDAVKGWLSGLGMMDDRFDEALGEIESPHDEDCPSRDGKDECDCTIQGYDDDDSGGPWFPKDDQTGSASHDSNGDGRWWKAHDGVESYEMHFHSGSVDHGGDVPSTNHRHSITPVANCSLVYRHAPHTFRDPSRFCPGVALPENRCHLRIRHEEHAWPLYDVLAPKSHCDGKGRA